MSLVRRILLSAGLAAVPALCFAQGTVVGSKHDLGKSSAGVNYQPCLYCHTPHQANSSLGAPLWNRTIAPNVSFLPYQSDSIDSPCPATPSPASLACLGCHDNVNAGDGYVSPMIPGGDKHVVVNPWGGTTQAAVWNNTNCIRCHLGHGAGTTPAIRIVGTDLRNDHPISMLYPTATQDPGFNQPPDPLTGWAVNGAAGLRLYSGKVECPTCHNPHDPTVRPFLRKSNEADALCKTCHLK